MSIATNLTLSAKRVIINADDAASEYSREWGEAGHELTLTKKRFEDIFKALGNEDFVALSLDDIIDLEQDGEISVGEYDALEAIIYRALS